jgi:hypothetical protein
MNNTEPRLTRGEYWMLELAATTKYPLSILIDPELELAANKQGHGLDRDGVIRTLSKLFAEDLIAAYQYGRFDFGKEKLLGALTPAQISLTLKEAGLRKVIASVPTKAMTPRTYYCLTAKGGATWEAFAAPNWNRFIDDSATTVSFDLEGGWIEEVICADRELLERYFHSLKRLKDGVVESSIVWDEMRPWQATYWKELPVGYRVRLRYLCDRSTQSGWYEVRTAEDVEADYYLMQMRNWWYSWQ